MLHRLYPLLLLHALALGGSWGLEVGPVRLYNNKTYITYKLEPSVNNSLLVCDKELQDGEQVHSVSWVLWRDAQTDQRAGSFIWSTVAPSQAEGVLEGVVSLDRDDDHLQLTRLSYNVSGFYSCRVNLTTGQSHSSPREEILVIDTTSNHYRTSSYTDKANCELEVSFESFAVYPEPTVQAGLYSESEGGYLAKVTPSQWKKVVYANQSVAYSYHDLRFKLDANTPTDVVYRNIFGVTKSNGVYIPLGSTESKDSSWSLQGCTLLHAGQGQLMRYRGGVDNCRGEYAPYLSDNPTVVFLCDSGAGYYAQDNVTRVTLQCDSDNLTWVEQDGVSLSDLHCEKNKDGGDGDGGAAGVATVYAGLVPAVLLLADLTRRATMGC